MDKSHDPRPIASLESQRDNIAFPSKPTAEQVPASRQAASNKDALKGYCLILALVVAAVILWHYGRSIILFSSFAVTWFVVAYFGLRHKKSKLLSIGGGLILGTLAFIAISTILKKVDIGTPPDKGLTSENLSDGESDAWVKMDLETRKALTEAKYAEAVELSNELNRFLSAANKGNVSVEMLGRIQVWKGMVSSTLKEVEETGFEAVEFSGSTGMGRIHWALQNMQFAWDNFERVDAATSAESRRTYASKHANSLKMVRDGLNDAQDWMEQGQY